MPAGIQTCIKKQEVIPITINPKLRNIFHSLFSPTLDFRVRLFNILALGGTVIQPDHSLSQSQDRFLGKCTDQFCAGCNLRRAFFFIPITVENISAAT